MTCEPHDACDDSNTRHALQRCHAAVCTAIKCVWRMSLGVLAMKAFEGARPALSRHRQRHGCVSRSARVPPCQAEERARMPAVGHLSVCRCRATVGGTCRARDAEHSPRQSTVHAVCQRRCNGFDARHLGEVAAGAVVCGHRCARRSDATVTCAITCLAAIRRHAADLEQQKGVRRMIPQSERRLRAKGVGHTTGTC